MLQLQALMHLHASTLDKAPCLRSGARCWLEMGETLCPLRTSLSIHRTQRSRLKSRGPSTLQTVPRRCKNAVKSQNVQTSMQDLDASKPRRRNMNDSMRKRLRQKSQWKSAHAMKPRTALPNSMWIIPAERISKKHAAQRAGIMFGHQCNQMTIVRKPCLIREAMRDKPFLETCRY